MPTCGIEEVLILRICYLHREMENVINDKAKNEKTCHCHGSRRESRSLISGYSVFHRFGCSIFTGKLEGRHNMGDEGGHKNEAHDPKQRPQRMKEFGISIDAIPSEEYLQITREMSKNIQNPD